MPRDIAVEIEEITIPEIFEGEDQSLELGREEAKAWLVRVTQKKTGVPERKKSQSLIRAEQEALEWYRARNGDRSPVPTIPEVGSFF